VNAQLFAQQKQPSDRKCNADDSLPRWWFAEEKNPRDGHDGRAASKNCRNGGERTTFLEEKKKGDRAGADANASKQGITKTSATKFLISSCKPENRHVDQDRQCRTRFDNETAKTFTDAIGGKTGKDLVRAVKYRSNDRVPKPSSHKTGV